jgi:hypothetical protein
MDHEYVETVAFVLTSGDPASDSNALELEDSRTGRILMEIRCLANGDQELIVYPAKQPFSLPLRSMVEGIEIARREVKNFPVPPTDEAGNFVLPQS